MMIASTIPAAEPRIERAAYKSLSSNVAFLYAGHFVNYLVPLATVPYLARVLGAAGWGEYVLAESYGRYIAMIIEYGFALSATREAARLRGDKEGSSRLVSSVLGAQSLLAIVAVLGFSIALLCFSGPAGFRALPLASVFWALFEGCNLIWYFQGAERIKVAALGDVMSKALALVAIFLFVKQPQQAWMVLFLRGVAAFSTFSISLFIASRDLNLRVPAWSQIQRILRDGFTLFTYRSTTALTTAGNLIVLGWTAPPTIVGYFASAEKVSKATLGLLQPVGQALFPRISSLQTSDGAHRYRLLGLALMGLGGTALGASLFWFAPFLIESALGPAYARSVGVLQILAVLQPIAALTSALGLQWLLPLRMDRAFNYAAMVSGVMSIAITLLLTPRFAEQGPAYALLIAQSMALAVSLEALRRRGDFSFGRSYK